MEDQAPDMTLGSIEDSWMEIQAQSIYQDSLIETPGMSVVNIGDSCEMNRAPAMSTEDAEHSWVENPTDNLKDYFVELEKLWFQLKIPSEFVKFQAVTRILHWIRILLSLDNRYHRPHKTQSAIDYQVKIFDILLVFCLVQVFENGLKFRCFPHSAS